MAAIAEQATAPRVDRDPWLDNTRFLAAVLVAAFHFLELHMVPGSFVQWAWGATWGLRLPVFAMLAGLFSTATPRVEQRQSLVRRVLFPLVVVTIAHWFVQWWLTGELSARPSEPAYTLWFLYAIVVWRMVLPYLALLKRPIVWSVLAALIVALPGFWHPSWSMAGIVSHLPCFLIGWKLREHLPVLRRRRVGWSVAAVAFMVGVAVVVGILVQVGVYSGEPQGMLPYRSDNAWMLAEILLRLAIITSGALTALGILHLMPRRHLPIISRVGSHGFTIYLLHGLVVLVLRGLGVLTPGEGRIDDPSVWAIMALTVVVVLILGSTPVHSRMRWLIRPRLRWLFRKKGAE